MSRYSILKHTNMFIAAVFLLLTATFSISFAEWPENGVQVSPDSVLRVAMFRVAPDSTGGAYVVWKHGPDNLNTVAQHIDLDGNLLWDEPGVSVTDPDSMPLTVLSDALPAPGGCVYISYTGLGPDGYLNMFVQKLSPDGERLYGPYGVALTNEPMNQENVTDFSMRDVMVPDGEGGIIQGYWALTHPPNNASVHAARMDSSGEVLWTDAIVANAGIFPHPFHAQAISDNAGGVIFSWESDIQVRDGEELYVQRLDADGNMLWDEVNLIYDEEPNRYAAMCSWEPGEAMLAVHDGEYIGEWRIFHLDSEGNQTLGENGMFLIEASDYSNIKRMAAADGYLYIPFADEYPDRKRKLFKINESGEHFFGEEGLDYDTCNYSSTGIHINIFADEDRVTTIFPSFSGEPWSPTAQAVNTDGTFPWGRCARDLIAYDPTRYYYSYSCETGSDTFFVAFSEGETIRATMLYPNGYSASQPDLEVKTIAEEKLPVVFSILSAYPNPFNSEVVVKYDINQPGLYRFMVFNLNGQMIYMNDVKLEETGQYDWNWNSAGQASGIYFISLKMAEYKQVTNNIVKVVLLK